MNWDQTTKRFIIEIEPGLWEIVDEQGESVFSTHCEAVACGLQMFCKDIPKTRICHECREAYRKAGKKPQLIQIDSMVQKEKEREVQITCKYCPNRVWRQRKRKSGSTCVECSMRMTRARALRQRHEKVPTH